MKKKTKSEKKILKINYCSGLKFKANIIYIILV